MEEIKEGEGGLPEEVSPFPEVGVEGEAEDGDEEEGEAFCSVYEKQKQKLRPIRSNVHSYPFEELGGFESVDELMKFKSQVDAHFMSDLNHHFTTNINSTQYYGDHVSSSSCDKVKQKKKKRKRRKKMESYVEEMMRQVMEKQEQMQQQLMEMIQNKEKERVVREQEWRRQQMLRLNNDHHVRSHQAARSLALISFIRNTLNHFP